MPSMRAGSPTMMPIGVPKVAYKAPGAYRADWIDLYNRMYRERILFLGKQIDDEQANQMIGIMLYLDSEDNSKQISMYINSPGGSVTAGFAMFDTIRHIKSDGAAAKISPTLYSPDLVSPAVSTRHSSSSRPPPRPSVPLERCTIVCRVC